MTVTPRALGQVVQHVRFYLEPNRSDWLRISRVNRLCDRVELLTPLADDWDWSTWDRLEPMPEAECNCQRIDVDLDDASMCEVHGNFKGSMMGGWQ